MYAETLSVRADSPVTVWGVVSAADEGLFSSILEENVRP